jgi:hypothetical protein
VVEVAPLDHGRQPGTVLVAGRLGWVEPRVGPGAEDGVAEGRRGLLEHHLDGEDVGVEVGAQSQQRQKGWPAGSR